MNKPLPPERLTADALSTRQVASMLGVTVRTVQLMVDRGDLQAWKTPGGHRRITRASAEQWQSGNSPRARAQLRARDAQRTARRGAMSPGPVHCLVLIEPSVQRQQLIGRVLARTHPHVQLHTAGDAITGLTLCSALRPECLVVNAQLPGVDGMALIRGLNHQPEGSQPMSVVALVSPQSDLPDTHGTSLPQVQWLREDLAHMQLPALVARLWPLSPAQA